MPSEKASHIAITAAAIKKFNLPPAIKKSNITAAAINKFNLPPAIKKSKATAGVEGGATEAAMASAAAVTVSIAMVAVVAVAVAVAVTVSIATHARRPSVAVPWLRIAVFAGEDVLWRLWQASAAATEMV